MARRREPNIFSLSFLDIMSCGFGAVILIFIVIDHASEIESSELSEELIAEVRKLEDEVKDGAENLVQIRNTMSQTDDEIITAESMAREIITEIRQIEREIQALNEDGASSDEDIEALKQELKELEKEAERLQGTVGGDELDGTALRQFVGEGNRQYLTGINVGGTHVLILMDASASMLHKTIVNAIRMSNMDKEAKLRSKKWQRAIRTTEWIMANLPPRSKFQLMTFNTTAEPVLPGTDGDWLTSIEREQTDAVLARLKDYEPRDGTSLHHPFAAVSKMAPMADNIFLIVDSLPTIGDEPQRRTAVPSRERVRLFLSALEELPEGIPVNVILFPMEGDPMATPHFWILSQLTGGSFITPSEDWP